MRSVIITREKKCFVGILIKYLCVLNMSQDKFQQYIGSYDESLLNELTQIIPISNGKSISIEISEQENELFIAAITSTGLVLSNQVTICAKKSNAVYSIKTDYSFVTGTSLSIVEG